MFGLKHRNERDANGIGLVLSGGGAKGAYQAGIWKAMTELGLAKRVRAFSGTSVGAINAAAFAAIGDPHGSRRSGRSMSARPPQIEARLLDKADATLYDSGRRLHGSPCLSRLRRVGS